MICFIIDCNRAARSRGLCKMHWTKAWRRDELDHYDEQRVRPPDTCQIDDCAELHIAKGMCRWHYDQSRRGEAGRPYNMLDDEFVIERLVEMTRLLKTNEEIAQELGTTSRNVIRWRQRLNLPSQRPHGLTGRL